MISMRCWGVKLSSEKWGYTNSTCGARIVSAAGLRKFLKFSVQNGACSALFGNKKNDNKLTTLHQKLCNV